MSARGVPFRRRAAPGDFFTTLCAVAVDWPPLTRHNDSAAGAALKAHGFVVRRSVLVLTRRVRRVSPPEDVCLVLLDDRTLREVDAKVLDEALLKWQLDRALEG